MKHILFLLILFFGNISFGQMEKEDDDYLFQTYTIFEITLLNELIAAKQGYDSIQVMDKAVLYTIDSTWNLLPYPAEYSLTVDRKDQKIKTIKTEYIKAEFSYNRSGKVEKIKFIYNEKVRDPLYEGTSDYYLFNYEKGQLISCFDYGVYGRNHPFRYSIIYY